MILVLLVSCEVHGLHKPQKCPSRGSKAPGAGPTSADQISKAERTRIPLARPGRPRGPQGVAQRPPRRAHAAAWLVEWERGNSPIQVVRLVTSYHVVSCRVLSCRAQSTAHRIHHTTYDISNTTCNISNTTSRVPHVSQRASRSARRAAFVAKRVLAARAMRRAPGDARSPPRATAATREWNARSVSCER